MIKLTNLEILEDILFNLFDNALANYYMFNDFEILKDVKIEIYKDYNINLTVTQLYKTLIEFDQAYRDCDIEKIDNIYNKLNIESI